MNHSASTSNQLESLIESCKPSKKRGRHSHKRQLQEIRDERKINLQTSDSVVVATNLKSILTVDTLLTLPQDCQQQLVRLLPKFDQISVEGSDLLQANKVALNNEYFAKFCEKYIEKLSDNKLSEDAIEQARQDKNKELGKLDPWKLLNYEPIWGQKLISQTILSDEDERKRVEKLVEHV